MVDLALRAADALAGEASLEVLDLRTVWPLDDEAILASLGRTSRVCVLQEASSSLGAAGQVLSLIAR
jgi:pyruvate dehydrogenase E1 component beta subunit